MDQDLHNFELVFVDTETTGFGANDEVCQIAALHGQTYYNSYIVPSAPMNYNASMVTGLTVNNGKMFLHGKKLKTVSKETAILGLIQYLDEIREESKNQPGCKIILVGHNVLRFDHPRIKCLAELYNLYQAFSSIVYGYLDTLPLFKQLLPDRVKDRKSFSQEQLVRDYLPGCSTEHLHNAVEDIRLLKRLFEKFCIAQEEIRENCKSLETLHILKKEEEAFKKNKFSLEFLRPEVSSLIINKMARQGINQDVLLEAYSTNQTDGIVELLSGGYNGVKITTCPSITKNICTKLDELANYIFDELD